MNKTSNLSWNAEDNKMSRILKNLTYSCTYIPNVSRHLCYPIKTFVSSA